MRAAQGATLHAIRQEADRLEGVSEGRFHSLRELDSSGASEKLVLAAAARGRDGDHDALRLLYLRYADNVYGYICSLVHDEHEAEDVTQQLFASLGNRLARYEPRAAPFSSWILRVAHNAAIDHVRARRPVLCEEVRTGDSVCDEPHQQSRDLREALDSLPEDQRLVIVMRFILGLSPAEVAERIGRSEDAVHGLQHRGRRSLRAALENLGAAPVTLTPRTAIPKPAPAPPALTT
jgi:RNA polymerase sigma-70 factor (ECF subfamily)